MPINLDSCIAGVFTPGNIGASSGLPPVEPVYISRPGAVMFEAASAAAVVSAGVAYTVAINETATAADAPSSTISVFAADVVEVGTTADTVDATVTSAPVYATWDAGTVTAVTLSGGDLVASNTGTTSTSQGAHVASAKGRTTGKYYFEVQWTTLGGGANLGFGIGTTASTYSAMGGNATVGNMVFRNGNVYANGSLVGGLLGVQIAGNRVDVAVDLGARLIWFRGVSGFWNSTVNASNNPATGVGGVAIPAGTMVPFCTFGGSGGAANNVLTANFGASAFAHAVPSGFTSGWI